MVGNRASLPTYQQVFGQDESDDDFDADVKRDPSRSPQQNKAQRNEDEQLLTGQKHNPWQEDGSYSPVDDDAPVGRKARSRRARVSEKVDYEERESPVGYANAGDYAEFEDEKLGYIPPQQPSRVGRFFKRYVIPSTLTVLFFVIAYGAYRASQNHFVPGQAQQHIDLPEELLNDSRYKCNGTALFAPTTIVISLDGFRADFLQRGLTPTLNAFISQGVSPKYMLPSFPSVTFPNHYTMVTGLYPEAHGVVGNTFWDPESQQEFSYHDPSHSMQPEWWNGEPLWITAESQGVRTAAHMWPGSEAHIGDIEPAFVDKFNGTEDLDRKVQRVLELLDKPGVEDPTAIDQRPQLVLAYVPNVDHAGHLYGPNSTEISDTIMAVDTMLYAILRGLDERNLTDIVNIVVVSDHGMATTSVDRLVPLEEIVDMDLIEHIDGWPHYGLRPYSQDPEVLDMLYNRLLSETAYRDGFDVYLRDKTMPERYHFSNNDRIAPLWLIAKTGWAIVTSDEMEEAQTNGYHPKGIHGYDNEHPLMRAIFVAKGPAFPHEPNSRVEVFQNTEVYNIICDSVGVEPTPNNGTLRLPFQPVGLHSDFEDVEEDQGLAADPPMTSFVPQISTIFKEPATATVGSDRLGFTRPTPADEYYDSGLGNGTEYENSDSYEDADTTVSHGQDPASESSHESNSTTSTDPSNTESMETDEDSYDDSYDGDYDDDASANPSSYEETSYDEVTYDNVVEVTHPERPHDGDVQPTYEEAESDDVETTRPADTTRPSDYEDSSNENASYEEIDDTAQLDRPQTSYDDDDADDYDASYSAAVDDTDAPLHDYTTVYDSEHRLDVEPARPVLDDEPEPTTPDEDAEESSSSWSSWFSDRFNDVKGWVTGLLGGDKDKDASDGGAEAGRA